MNHSLGRQAILALVLSWALVETGAAQLVGTALVNNGPTIQGTVDGNLQQMTGTTANINGSGAITGDLLVPGTPTFIKNGTPTFGGTIAGTGSSSPSNYQVILNGNGARLGHLRTRTNPAVLPTLPAVPSPTGTRTVTITSAGQSAGSFATLKNLTLNGNVGQYTIPAGTYGDFIANGGAGFTLGVAGATQPAVYNLQHLTLNGATNIVVLGPVVINVANGFTANGAAGTSANPAWLKINIVVGGFTVNGGCTLYSYVTLPSGTLTINGNAKLTGGAISKDVTVNANGLLKLFDVASFENHPPVAANQSVTTPQDTAKAIILSATDADGQTLTYSVVAQPAHAALSGTAPQLTYTPTHGYYGADSFTFKANDGQVDSNVATVSIAVTHVNHAPAANPGTLTLNQDTSASVVLAGSDVDNDPLTFRVTTAPAHGALSGTPPNLTYTPAAHFYGTDSFAFVANDGALDSAPATISITVNHVNHPPVASGQSISTNEDTPAPILLSATDSDSDPLTFAVVTSPAHGVLSGTAPNLTYTPTAHFFGSDSFTFRANDGSANSNIATVQITVLHVNHPPAANGQNISLDEDTTAAVVLTGSDPDGDAITFSISTQPQHGTLSGTPPNVVYTPAPDYYGMDLFSFRTSDGTANSQDGIVNLTVRSINDPPTVQISAPASGAQFDAGDTVHISATGLDKDGTIATFRLLVDGAVVSEKSQTATAAFDLIDVAAGDHSISAVVIDNEGASAASMQVPITVRSQGNGPVQVNAGPDRLISLPSKAHLNGSVTVNGAQAGSNVDLAWQKVSGPGNATFDNSGALTPTVTFDAPGDYVLKLVATAPEGRGFDTARVTVLAAPQAGVDSPVSSLGREFWMAFLSGLPPTYEKEHCEASLTISAEVATSGTVEIFRTSQFDGVWQTDREVRNFSVPAGGNTLISITKVFSLRYEDQLDQSRKTSIHVQADNPVAVHALNADDATTDGSLILPTGLLGREHFVMSYRNGPHFQAGGGVIGGTQFAVVATKPQTQVTITPTVASAAHPAGQPFTVTMQTGEVYRLLNKTDVQADFTGTRIQSDKPVAVFSGSILATVPAATAAADHLFEQMPPVDLWGRHFVTFPLKTRHNGDRFRMLAANDGTHVSVNGGIVATLNRGEFFETVLTDPSSVVSDQRILLAQFAHSSGFDNTTGDPFLSLVPPYETFGRHYILSTAQVYNYYQGHYVDMYDSYLSVIVDSAHAGAVNINGQPIATSAFVPIGDSGFSGASVSVPKNSTLDISSPTPVGTWIYGWAAYESYGFTGGLYAELDAGSAHLDLTQSSSAAPIGSTHHVRAQLTNASALVVPGARVDFAVTGANPITGSGYTAPDGSIEFSWQGSQAGTDTVTATSGSLTATVSVTWIATGGNQPPHVNAGPDRLVKLGDPLTLQGLAQDDGLPAGGQLVLQWSALPGPGDVAFSDSSSATTTATFIYPGQYRIRLTAYDGQFSGEDDLVVTVDIPPAFDSLDTSPLVVDQGSQWGVVVNARDQDGTIVRVELLEGAQVLASYEQNNSRVFYLSLNTVLNNVGQHTITVRLTDDQGATTDRSFNVTVRPAPIVHILSPADNTTITGGQSVVFTASASSQGGAITQLIYQDVTSYPFQIGEGTGPNYSFTWTPSYAGTFQIAATAYDSAGAAGTSAPVTITVLSPGDPTVTITSPQNGSSIYRGLSAPFHADASAVSAATIDSVSFYDGYNYLGSKYSPPYEVPWFAGNDGPHNLRADVYDTFGGYSSTSIMVNVIEPPDLTVTLVQPPPNIPVKVNSPTTLAATIDGVVGSLDGVQFYVNGQLVGDGISESATWTPTAVGTYEIEVDASSSSPNQFGYIITNVTVADLHSPVVQWNAPANNASFAPGTPIGLQAQASDVDGNLSKLQFQAEGQQLSESAISGSAGVASFTWDTAGPGWHTLAAVAADDTLQTGSASLRVFVQRTVTNDLLPPSAVNTQTTSANGIHVAWTPSTSTSSGGTVIEHSLGYDGAWEEVATVDPTVVTYDDSGLESETYYRYRLASLDANGARSPYSGESFATTFVEMPTYAIVDITESLAQNGIAAHLFDFKHLIASNSATGTTDPIELNGTRALSVNDNGQVLVDLGSGNYTVWKFQDQSYTQLAKGTESIVARAINSQGVVAGSSDHSYQDADNHVHLEFRAQTWISGAVNEITPHDSLGNYHEPRDAANRGLSDYEVFEAYGIGDSGDVVGRATVYYRDYDYTAQHAAMWSGNEWINLGGFAWLSDNHGRMLPSYAATTKMVNGAKQVVGVGAIDSPQLPNYPPGTGPQHAFLSNGRNWNAAGRIFQDLGTLGGYESAAWDVNSNGFVIGVSTKQQTDPAWRLTGFVWEGSGAMKELPTLGGINTDFPQGYSYPIAINNQNRIVGQSLRLDRSTAAALWQKNQNNGAPAGTPSIYEKVDLNDVVGSYRDWFLVNARDISNSGLIVGQGIRYTRDGHGQIIGEQEKAYLLIPIKVQITQPLNQSIFAFCDNVELRAQVSGLFANLVTRVEYWEGNTKIGESTNTQDWPAVWIQPPQGNHLITARGVIGSTTAYAESGAINLTVLPISRRAVNFIIDAEVSGRSGYQASYRHPTWPRTRASGVTIGIGYDLGQNTAARIRQDWQPFLTPEQVDRLVTLAGIRGNAADARLSSVADIDVPFETALQVYYQRTLPRFIDQTLQVYPEAAGLSPNSFGSLVSLIYNRGNSLRDADRNRNIVPDPAREMRDIATALQDGTFDAIPQLLRDMERIWRGMDDYNGLRNRRNNEADLFQRGLDPNQNQCD